MRTEEDDVKREDLIEAIDDLVRVIDPDPARILDAVEPLIRADERAQIADGLWTYIVPITDWIAGVNYERTFREEHRP